MILNNLILFRNELLYKILILRNISNLLYIFISEIVKFNIHNIIYEKI